jgi:hypothetical protein
VTRPLKRWAAWSGVEVKTVGVAVCGVHLGEKVVEDSEGTERVECARVSQWVLERDVTPRSGSEVGPLIECVVVV